jgi:hypothetical protein
MLQNPYFARFASSASTTVLADAVAQDPTFSLWIEWNDVLGYATSGGSGRNQTGNMNPAIYHHVILQILLYLLVFL